MKQKMEWSIPRMDGTNVPMEAGSRIPCIGVAGTACTGGGTGRRCDGSGSMFLIAKKRRSMELFQTANCWFDVHASKASRMMAGSPCGS